jgi:type IV secretion system protein VirB8
MTTPLNEAASWAIDRRMAEARSARRAWGVAVVAATIAALEAVALAGLAPLKTLVPMTVLVDRTTGFAQAVAGNGGQTITPDAALAQALLAQYVIAREGMDRARLAQDYRRVALWSDGAVRRDYIAAMQAGSGHEPPGGTITAVVESVSLTGAGQAQVRFVTTRRPGQGAPQRAYWVARLAYHFSGAPMAMADRLDNPLGLAVTGYIRDAEVPPPAVEEAP